MDKYIELIKKGKVKEAIYNKIKDYRNVSFVELERLEKHMPDYQEEVWYTYSMKYKTLIVWWFRSKRFLEIIIKLKKEDKIKLEGTQSMVYFMDGKVPNTPIAKRVHNYKDQRWIPTILNVK